MVKRIWFQFTRKAHDERQAPRQTMKSDGDTSEKIQSNRREGADSPPFEADEPARVENQPSGEMVRKETDTQPPVTPGGAAAVEQHDRSAAVDAVLLRLSGNLWIHPAGEYRRIAITAERDIKSRNSAAFPVILPAGIHLDVGEIRWLGGHTTAVHEETRAELSPDLPFSATVVVRLAYMALRVGELIYRPPGDGDIRGQAEDEAFAWGTGLLRQTEVYGTFFDERFHFEQLELERLQLIQAEQAWIGQLAQTIGAAYEGPTGRALVQQLRAAQSFADPLALIRRIAQRHARTMQIR